MQFDEVLHEVLVISFHFYFNSTMDATKYLDSSIPKYDSIDNTKNKKSIHFFKDAFFN